MLGAGGTPNTRGRHPFRKPKRSDQGCELDPQISVPGAWRLWPSEEKRQENQKRSEIPQAGERDRPDEAKAELDEDK